MKNSFHPLEFYTPVFEKNRPVFPDSPMRVTPFFLHNMKNWKWTVKVPTLTLQYLMTGHIKYNVDGRSYEATKGTCFLFRPGQQLDGHSLDGKPVTMFAAHFSQLPELEADEGLIWTPIREVTLFEAAAVHAVKCRQRNDSGSLRHTYASLMQLFCLLEENLSKGKTSPIEEKIEELVENIKYDPGADWRVEVMCDTTELSRSQLTRWFNRITGNPPNRYVIEQRIARAVQMLGTTNAPISEIADALGYSDLPFFIRQFRKEIGTPPGSLRK